jgi:hypothetical protein
MAFSVFLVERYLPVSAVNELSDSVARVEGLCADPAGGHSAVDYLLSAYLPADDTCFCVFRAASVEAVRAVNVAGRFAFDRISGTVLLVPGTRSSRGLSS